MDELILTLLISVTLTACAYMAFPVIRLIVNHGRFPKNQAHKIALWNSIIVGAIFCILTIATYEGGTVWQAGPAFLYYGINRAILTDKNAKSNETGKRTLPSITKATIKTHSTPSLPRVLFCRKCGIKLEPNYRFCSICGTEILTNTDNSLQQERNHIVENEPVSTKECYSIENLAGAMMEICSKELIEIMDLCDKYHIRYNEQKMVVATFGYFYAIWICNLGSKFNQRNEEILSIYKNKFFKFNSKLYENLAYTDIVANEREFESLIKRVIPRILATNPLNSDTFIDDGISDELILEFITNPNDKDIIKDQIVIKVLRDWTYIAQRTGEHIFVEN